MLSTGEFYIPGQSRGYRDDKRGGHGRVDLVQAIAQSVNTYFYSLALDMGIDRFSECMGKFGFGKPTGIDLIGESAGVLPSREWKRGRINQPWYPGETVIAGIGQGYWVVTPLQLAQRRRDRWPTRACRIAPHLLRAVQTASKRSRESIAPPAARPSMITQPGQLARGAAGHDRSRQRAAPRTALNDGFPVPDRRQDRHGRTLFAHRRDWTSISDSPIERHQVLFEAFTPADDARIAVDRRARSRPQRRARRGADRAQDPRRVAARRSRSAQRRSATSRRRAAAQPCAGQR